MIADLIAAGLHLGWTVLIRPTIPATRGVDIEVPVIVTKEIRRSSGRPSVCAFSSVLAAIIFVPGAVTSG